MDSPYDIAKKQISARFVETSHPVLALTQDESQINMCRCEHVPTALAFPTSQDVSYPQNSVHPSNFASVPRRLHSPKPSTP